MKRIYYYLILLVMVGSMTSCNKFLNTQPLSFASPENNYATEPQLLQALAGVYDVLGYKGAQLYADNLFDKLGATTDEGFYARSSVNALTESYSFDYTEPNIDATWQTLYIGIERANNLIYYINTPKSMDPVEKNAILGEAEFLRGYYYFLLVSNFGDVPMRLLPTTITGASTSVAFTKSKDVYTQILSDMEDAATKCYPATHFGNSSRVSQTTVDGIIARVCLTMAGHPLMETPMYDTALVYAQKVVSSGIHSLNPSYSQIFINEAQDVYDIKEAMWEADFYGNELVNANSESGRLGNTNGIAYSASNYADTGYSYGFINATAKLYNLYGPGDQRRDWAIAPYGYSGTNRVNKGTLIYDRNCGKWRRSYETLTPKSKNNTGENFPILRYADVLLMLAEADNQVNNGPSANAYNAINQVRRRAYGFPLATPNVISDLPAGLSQAAFQDTIVNERARELCFEALRRPDLIRWGIWTSTMQDLANQMNVDLVMTNNSYKYAFVPASNAASSPKFLLYPIPVSEFSVNKAATQNPGY